MLTKHKEMQEKLFRLKMETHPLSTLKHIAYSAQDKDSAFTLDELAIVLNVIRGKMTDEDYTKFVVSLNEDQA